MDVLAFVLLLLVQIWIVLPETAGDPTWSRVFTLAALGVMAASFWRRRTRPAALGLRLDNLLPGIGLYVGAALLYAGAVLLWHRDVLLPSEFSWPDPGKALMLFAWAFLQEICLLAFLFNRLWELTDSRRAAVLASAGLFAVFHLPNPFLTLYTLGGGIILAYLYARVPNLVAATLAHALASALVAALLPDPVTGWMKIGPLYLWAAAR